MDIKDAAGLGKLADSKLVNKVYDDSLSPLLKQLGEFGEDVAKTGRLILAPFQVLAAQQDRFARWAKQIAEAVPEERRQEPTPEIAIPVLRSLAYLPDDNVLADMYLELLTRAMDKDRSGEAHPAFIRIIEQLAPDEVLLLDVLREEPPHKLLHEQGKLMMTGPDPDESMYKAALQMGLFEQPIRNKDMLFVYLGHLNTLDLIKRSEERIGLTAWGLHFVRACRRSLEENDG